MSESVIKVENLAKQYYLRQPEQQPYVSLRDVMADGFTHLLRFPGRRARRHRRARAGLEPFWALRDVSFEIKSGEVMGLIGRNGAGKSTLLKILSRITPPTAGRVTLRGRASSLLEVGTGFHPELTGRENIFLNGTILGMKRSEIKNRFDEIVGFAEVDRFLDTPVKRYSSGMYVRLAFAVAAHLEPEILIVDEVLAVGDAAFQRKCLNKMGDVASGGRTVLFVSHNMAAIEALCGRACLLEEGRIVSQGDTKQVVSAYFSSLETSGTIPMRSRTDRLGDGRLKFTDIRVTSLDGAPCGRETVQSGDTVEFSVGYESGTELLKNVAMSIDLFAPSGQCMLILNNAVSSAEFDYIPGVGRLRCRVGRFPLSPGQYPVTLFCQVNGTVADWVKRATTVTVESGDFFGNGRMPPASHGGFLVRQAWDVVPVEPVETPLARA